MNKPTLSKVICILFVFCAATAIAPPAQVLTTLYSFTAPSEGQFDFPGAGLVQAPDGNFYGTTYTGGAYDTCNGYSGCGTVFKITPSGALTTLYSFAGYPSDGALPNGLVQGSVGNFYGTTGFGGAYGHGTAFRLVTLSGEKLQSDLMLRAVLTGYEPWSDRAVPNSNEIAITLRKK